MYDFSWNSILKKIFVVIAGLAFATDISAIENNQEQLYKFMHLSINDGLSNNQVRSVLKDSRGFMWFGTGRGLNRFDGLNFKVFKHDPFDEKSIPFNGIDYLFEDFDQKIWIRSLDSYAIYDPEKESFAAASDHYKETSIPLNSLRNLYRDSKGNIWFVNSVYGLYKYDSQNSSCDSIKYIPPQDENLAADFFTDVKEGKKESLWVISNGGVVLEINHETKQTKKTFRLGNDFFDKENSFRLFVDSDNDVWIYSLAQPYGAFFIDTKTGIFAHYTDNSKPLTLNNNLVTSIVEDESGKIWLGTDHGGINIIDKANLHVTFLGSNGDNRYSISQNSITCLYKDSENIIWAGTYKRGVNYFHKNLVRFGHYNYLPSVVNSLPFDDVNCFVEDKKGNLWIGTNGGGLIYFNRKDNTFKSYFHNPADPASLCSNIIVSLFIDRNNQLWIGSYFGGLDRFDGKTFYHHRYRSDDPTSLSDDRVWEIFEDSKKNLWVGTLNGGLNLFDRDKNMFYHFRAGEMNSVGSNFIISMIEDSHNNLWLGTTDGLDRLELSTRRFYHYAPGEGIPGRLGHKNALDIHEDSRGYIWIATSEGLNVFDTEESRFRVFTEADGLADSNIKTILEDQQGNLWVATTSGISQIEVTNFDENPALDDLQINVANYDVMDGLQGKEFNEKAAYRTKLGELIFGGPNGFNIIIPENIDDQPLDNKIVLTNLKVFNQIVPVGASFRNRIILDKSITQQNEITLRHNENVFSFEFAALNFFHPEKNIFEYQLEGFNTEWLKTGNKNNDATFTNLNAGEYFLRIRVSDDGNNWTEMKPPLKIIILPPFWKSNFAFFIYFILIVLVLFVSWRILMERERLKFEAEQEHREAERIQQVDALKTRFFTNISHEFRTPLSLILTPLEKLISSNIDESHKSHLILIQRNARRLLSMVNQLLDFRKMEVQKIEAKHIWGDLVGFIREVGNSFQDMAENKQISFKFKSASEQLFTYFDHDKVDKIVSNLLSNAFKFTNEKGKIGLKLTVEVDESGNGESRNGNVVCTVKDSGIGIPPEKQSKIFDRFYQDDLPNTFVNQGSGIGLSMVSEYINILGGTIRVESIVGKGSSFIVSIPVQLFSDKEIEANGGKAMKENIAIFNENEEEEKEEPNYDKSKRTVLLVEDNDDFRFYLKDNLKGTYNIVEASNGQTGWEQTLKHLPDLVVSDVMMPRMNGIELCSKIKGDGRTSHVPVILLTAKVETEATLEGFSSGADDYILKPFDFRILESRIENIINSRGQLRLTYQLMVGINPEKIEVTSLDEKFIKKVLEVVEQNIGNTEFSVEDLSREVGMSRVSLYKKLLSLTKKSPVEFIRIIRLKRAADLMENSQISVSEIAYQVGFNSPRYFTKYFKEFYNELPSEYIAKRRKKSGNFTV